MDQQTPVMDSIKKEAGEAALAHMEERLAELLPLPRSLWFLIVLSVPHSMKHPSNFFSFVILGSLTVCSISATGRL